ncbi:hypothetical protein CLV72_1011154 [Allonocardiopsis opalescens]|uniref:LysR substrate binding domain-containing protein n=1 Tax=Allonocardiopsis opalescens TaxID=1144618 RepID=A0A2T0QF60_9ACTN|nr:hypothetical protein CLV72_1011154 [Allonocardiopsis opalescens]
MALDGDEGFGEEIDYYVAAATTAPQGMGSRRHSPSSPSHSRRWDGRGIQIRAHLRPVRRRRFNVRKGLAIALLPSAHVPHLTGLATVEITDPPMRVEYLIWSGVGRTPAATAFLDLLDLPDH